MFTKKNCIAVLCALLAVLFLFVWNSCSSQTGKDTGTDAESLTESEPAAETATQADTVKETESETDHENDTEPETKHEIETEPVVSYRFTSDAAGYAGGTVSVYVAEASTVTLYWGNENGRLAGYSYLSRAESDGGSAVLTIPDTTFLPPEATCLIAVCSPKSGDPEAEYRCELPESKRFSEKLQFTFGAVSDVHIGDRYDVEELIPAGHFTNALNTLVGLGAQTVAISGDITTAGNTTRIIFEYLQYSELVAEFHETYPEIGVFTCTGNHECMWGIDVGHFIEYTRTEHDLNYTGTLVREYYGDDELDFTVSVSDDVILIFLSQWYAEYGKNYDDPRILKAEQLEWLEARLAENTDKTVFLFFHTFLDDGAGDASTSHYEYDAPYNTADEDEHVFRALLEANPNVIFLNGHSHYTFDAMFVTPAADGKDNLYTNCMGGEGTFSQVHIPSVAAPSELKSDEQWLAEYEVQLAAGVAPEDIHVSGYTPNVDRSEGYLIRVYDDSVVLYGYDFVNEEYVSYACYILPRN